MRKALPIPYFILTLSALALCTSVTALADKPAKRFLVCHVGSELGPEGQPYDPYCDPEYSDCSADAGKVDLIETPRISMHIGNDEHSYLDSEGFLWKDYAPEAGVGGDPADFEDLNLDGIDDGCELELPAAVNHVISSSDPEYQEAFAPGLDPILESTVSITESGGSTLLRETDPLSFESYQVRLVAEPAPGTRIEITVTATPPSSEEQALGGDSVLVSDGGLFVPSVLLEFDNSNWNLNQTVFAQAPDDALAEGERIVPIEHNVDAFIETPDPTPAGQAAQAATLSLFDGAEVRSVAATVIDDDQPDLVITELDAGLNADKQTIVVEGTFGLTDQYSIALAKAPMVGNPVTIQLNPDGRLLLTTPDSRFNGIDNTITFAAGNYDVPVSLTVAAVDDAFRQGPQNVMISHTVATADAGRDASYDGVTRSLDVDVYDDKTAGAFVIESGGSTVVTRDGTVTDDYMIGLTSAPVADVWVNVVTDGRFDVDTINGAPVPYLNAIGNVRLVELFIGGIDFANNDLGQATLTRGLGRDRGSFIKDGFYNGMLLQVDGAGPGYDNDYIVTDVSKDVLTLNFGIGNPAKIQESGVVLSEQIRQGFQRGQMVVDTIERRLELLQGGRATNSWAVDGFQPGQRVRVTNLFNPAQTSDFKIASLDGPTLTFTAEGSFPAWLTGSLILRVQQIAAAVVFTPANWDQLQTVGLKGDPNF